MNRFNEWLRRLIEEPEDITLAALLETKRARRDPHRLETLPLERPALEPHYLASPVAQK